MNKENTKCVTELRSLSPSPPPILLCLSLCLSAWLEVEWTVLDYGLTIPLALAVTFRAIDYGRRVVCPLLLLLWCCCCCGVVVVAAVASIFSCISIIVIALRVQIVQFAVVVSSLWSVVCSRFWVAHSEQGPEALRVQLCIKVAPQNNPNARHILTYVCVPPLCPFCFCCCFYLDLGFWNLLFGFFCVLFSFWVFRVCVLYFILSCECDSLSMVCVSLCVSFAYLCI